MFLTHNSRVKNTAGRGQRIYGRVNAQLGNGTFQRDGGIEVSKGRHRSRIGIVVGRHVNGLHAGDRAAPGGGDPLL